MTGADGPFAQRLVGMRMSTFVSNVRESDIARGLSVFFAPRRAGLRKRHPSLSAFYRSENSVTDVLKPFRV